MANRDHFPEVYARLKALMQPLVPPLLVEADTASAYTLNAPPSPNYPQGIFFGGVRLGKSYVSYHLMALYAFPNLLNDVPDGLKKRMQGKSCFNFSRVDEEQMEELKRLTAKCFEGYKRAELL